MKSSILSCVVGGLVVVVGTLPAVAGTTTFENGIEGWGVFYSNNGGLGDFLEPTGGNPDEHLKWVMVDSFGATLRNDTNPDTIGDYTAKGGPIRLAIDVKVDSITFGPNQVARNLIVELVDYNDDPNNPYPSTSVWFNLGEISRSKTSSWTSFEVIIDDPTSLMLPAGWGGTGDEDPNTFEPVLPANRTFASVLESVEEIRFTTFEPGFFYGFTNFQLRFDNVTVEAVPEPSSLALLMVAGGWVALRRRSDHA